MRRFILFTWKNSLLRQFRVHWATGSRECPSLRRRRACQFQVLIRRPQPIPEDKNQKLKLAQWQTEIAQDGIKSTLHQLTGEVAEEILNQADAISADLIVMGTHSHGAIYNLLVGSATKGVLKHSTRPVLLVPGRKS